MLTLHILNGRDFETAGADESAGALVDFALTHFPGRCWRVVTEKRTAVAAGVVPKGEHRTRPIGQKVADLRTVLTALLPYAQSRIEDMDSNVHDDCARCETCTHRRNADHCPQLEKAQAAFEWANAILTDDRDGARTAGARHASLAAIETAEPISDADWWADFASVEQWNILNAAGIFDETALDSWSQLSAAHRQAISAHRAKGGA